MATELPKKPSDEDFEIARKYVAPGLRTFSVRECRRIRAVLRYLLAGYDAKPAPVAVPEDVVQWAKAVKKHELGGKSIRTVVADWVLSLVPEPVVEWEPRVDSDGNTHWLGRIGGKRVVDVVHCLRSGHPAYRIEYGGAKEYECDLAAAKARAEELCGVSTTKGA